MEQKSSYTQIIEASSAEELKSKIQELAAAFTSSATAPQATAAPAAKEAPKSPVSATGKPGRKSNAAKPVEPVVAEEAQDVSEQTPTADSSEDDVDPFADDEEDDQPAAIPSKPTFQDVLSVTQKISDTKGVQAVRELVAQFGEKKISAVKEKDYVKFLEAANKKLAE